MKKVTNIAAGSAIILLMLIAALVYISPRFGYRADAVRTNSMEPAIMTNSLVVAHQVDVYTLEVGDIITFRSLDVDSPAIGHRIVEINSTFPVSFQTKGDNLENPDPFPVQDTSVLGKVEFIAPSVGIFVQFLRTKIGLVVGLIIPALFIFWLVFKMLWKELVRYIRNSVPKES